MSRRMAVGFVFVFILAVSLAPASASIVSSATLQQLLDGDSLGWWTPTGKLVKVADNWGGWSNTGRPVDPANITLRARWETDDVICIYYQNGLDVRGNEQMDIFWEYDLITAPGHGIKSAGLELLTFGTTGNARINWAEVLEDNGGNKIEDLSVNDIRPAMYVPELPGWQPIGYEWMHVRKDLHLATNGSGDAFLSDWKQCYDQVPEASTLLFFGLGVLGAIGLRRRSLRA